MDTVIKRALISVSDKTGINELARELVNLDIEILSTGGTYKLLKKNKIPVREVSEYTEFPEILSGRVKTLHPKIHGGILSRRKKDAKVLEEYKIDDIDLVITNLYPFEQTIAKPDCTLKEAIENIDIGGPTMIRAAAKNYRYVTVIVDPKDYPALIEALKKQNNVPPQMRFHLATKAFTHTAHYDSAISNYLTAQDSEEQLTFPTVYNLKFTKQQELRYGENPHQKAAFYIHPSQELTGTLAGAEQIQGKALSYNNIADADAAWECVKQFDRPACVIVKHANPCGVATSSNITKAYQKAFQTDPTSAFGGIIAFNKSLDEKTVDTILENQFVEVIIAPEITERAQNTLAEKSNVRVLICSTPNKQKTKNLDYKAITGGLLVQEKDPYMNHIKDWKVVSQRKPNKEEQKDLEFAWQVAKYVKSNAIVYAKNNQTIGIGAGQMSRVYSAKIAHIKAQDEGLSIKGSVMASDAFFPFRDGVDTAAQAGVTAIIQPGGSVRDKEVIDAANEYNIAMILTGTRHFKH